MFNKYANKPRVVEAVQFTDGNKNQVFNALTGQYAPDFEDGVPIIKITTIHGGIAVVRFGDWIVKDRKPGTYYPIKDDVFHENYVVV